MAGSRRKARTVALQALYEIDCSGRKEEVIVERFLGEGDLSEESSAFIRDLANGVVENISEIDGKIQKFAPAWPINQIAVIDRNILRLAIFEILFDNKVSVKVAINEAVELAKNFGSNNSAKFVNGVLGSVSVLASR